MESEERRDIAIREAESFREDASRKREESDRLRLSLQKADVKLREEVKLRNQMEEELKRLLMSKKLSDDDNEQVRRYLEALAAKVRSEALAEKEKERERETAAKIEQQIKPAVPPVTDTAAIDRASTRISDPRGVGYDLHLERLASAESVMENKFKTYGAPDSVSYDSYSYGMSPLHGTRASKLPADERVHVKHSPKTSSSPVGSSQPSSGILFSSIKSFPAPGFGDVYPKKATGKVNFVSRHSTSLRSDDSPTLSSSPDNALVTQPVSKRRLSMLMSIVLTADRMQTQNLVRHIFHSWKTPKAK